jgi:DNA-binding MarR family transcriptional regulator
MTRKADAAAEATLLASRALMGVVARSMASALEVVTLPQFRVLVVLAADGPTRMGALAGRLGSNASTLTRTMDRIVAGGWAERTASPDSRREVVVCLTASGHALVDEVVARRRAELAKILERLSDSERASVEAALSLFAGAAGEHPLDELLVLGI